MNIVCEPKKGFSIVSLNGELTIYHVQEALKSLESICADGVKALRLNLSGITEIDTAGVQLLLFLHRKFNRAKVSIQVSNDVVDEVLVLLQLSSIRAQADA